MFAPVVSQGDQTSATEKRPWDIFKYVKAVISTLFIVECFKRNILDKGDTRPHWGMSLLMLNGQKEKC